MRRTNLATLVYLAVVFASGVVVGGFAVRLYMARSVGAVVQSAPPSRAELRKQYVQEMRDRLRLTDPQITELKKIMDDTGQRMHEMHKSIGDEHVRKVIAMLNDTQRAEYAKLREERDRHRQEQSRK